MIASYELTPFDYQLLILCVVMVSKIIMTTISAHYPLRFFNFYCRLLSDKVLRSNAPSNQQTLAGVISVLITLIPLTLILWLFSAFIEVIFLWDAFLLYLAIGATALPKVSLKVASCLLQEKKQEAKTIISPWLLRQTEPLSAMGIAKANIEVLVLKSLQQLYVPIFIFFVTGPLSALTYRLLLEMRYAWNIKRSVYANFGALSYYLINIITWLPARLIAFIILLSSPPKRWLTYFRLSNEHFWQLNNNYLLQNFAYSLGVKLGGVALYGEKQTTTLLNQPSTGDMKLAHHFALSNNPESPSAYKLRKKQFNEKARQPDSNDILRATKKLQIINIIFLVILVLISVFPVL